MDTRDFRKGNKVRIFTLWEETYNQVTLIYTDTCIKSCGEKQFKVYEYGVMSVSRVIKHSDFESPHCLMGIVKAGCSSEQQQWEINKVYHRVKKQYRLSDKAQLRVLSKQEAHEELKAESERDMLISSIGERLELNEKEKNV